MPTRKDDDAADYGNDRGEHFEEGDAVRVHDAYLEHRLGGGEAADPAAYLRAIEQFQQLPGAMRSTPRSIERSDEDERTEGEPS